MLLHFKTKTPPGCVGYNSGLELQEPQLLGGALLLGGPRGIMPGGFWAGPFLTTSGRLEGGAFLNNLPERGGGGPASGGQKKATD